MRHHTVYTLQSIWQDIPTFLSKPVTSNPIFGLCSDKAIAAILHTQGIESCLIPLQTCIDFTHHLETFVKRITNNVSPSVQHPIAIVNVLGWEQDAAMMYHKTQLERFIAINFEWLKCLNRLLYSIHYIWLQTPLQPLAGIVSGMVLSIGKENPKIKFSSLTVTHLASLDFNKIVNQLSTIDNPILSLEKNQLREWQVKRLPSPEAADSPLFKNEAYIQKIQKGKCYVITGNGKIALLLAKYLHDVYAAKIVLLGRRCLHELEQATLKQSGVHSYIQVDMGNIETLRSVWQYCIQTYGNINGIFHLAGCLHDKLFLNKELKEFMQVLYPKVQCTIHLDLVSAETPLDFFVCFSSVTGAMGNMGQSDYAAANGFLRQWSHYRQYLHAHKQRYGLTFCIDWGLWKNGGMQLEVEQDSMLPLSDQEALQAMEWVLSHPLATATPIIVFKGYQEAIAPLKWHASDSMHELHQHTATPYEEATKAKQTAQIASQQQEEMELQLRQVIAWVRATVLQFTKLHDLNNQESMIAKGVDSVAAIHIITNLEKALRKFNPTLRIHKTILFEKPTLATISQYIYNQYLPEVQQLLGIPTSRDPSSVAIATALSNADHKPRNHANDIAIIGIAGQFPEANTIEALWENSYQGKNAIRLIPDDRWDWRQFYDPDPKVKGKSYGRHGGFISSIKQFDPLFFHISPADAANMDPQERLLLQNVYHALQNSCYAPDALAPTGVFVAAMYGHYTLYNNSQYVMDASFASIANRVSYCFNFTGPSFTVDSMCSGGLTALHLACQAIQNGDCDTAVVGGVNLMPHPVKYRLLAQGRFLSPTGKCHSFGKDADGYVPGEGVVVLVLKKRDKAIEANDKIEATILGSATNSGGKSASYTVPTASAQTKVIQKAIERAAIPLASIGYIETHGTGTSLGDPIEIQGLTAAYTSKEIGDKKGYCAIGSIKANIGHLESAAGLAGIAKILMQFKHKTIAPAINCSQENPLLNLDQTAFYLPKKAVYWEASASHPRRAGVSAFGAGGSNAHVILEEAPKTNTTPNALPIYLFPISGKTIASLQGNLCTWLSFLSQQKNISCYALCYSAACGQMHFRYRYAVAFSNYETLLQKLEAASSIVDWEATTEKGISKISIVQPETDYESYQAFMEQMRLAYLDGYAIPWHTLYTTRSPLPLPAYHFDQQLCWSKEFDQQLYWSKEFDQQLCWSKEFEASIQPAAVVLPIPSHQPEKANSPLDQPIYYFTPTLVEKAVQSTKQWDGSANVIAIGAFPYARLAACFAERLRQPTSLYFEDFPLIEKLINDSCTDRLSTGLLYIVMYLPTTETANDCIPFFYRLMHLLVKKPIDVHLLTFHQLTDHLHDAYHLALTGFLKSIVLEHNVIRAKCIVLTQHVEPEWTTLLSKETAIFDKKYEEIHYQNTIRYCKTYQKQDTIGWKGGPHLLLKNQGVYLIAGGLGQLGKIIAAHLLKTYHAKVILLGSSPLTHPKEKDLEKLQTLGGTAIYHQVDITHIHALQDAIQQLQLGSLNGVIHAAGIVKDKIFATKELDDFKKVIAIKAQGMLALDQATATQPLDFFINFSSIASVCGNVGQTDYAMGNAFLDACANIRNSWVKLGKRSGATLSINWPLWAEGGMQISSDKIKFLFDQQGMLPLSNEEGIYIFSDLLSKATHFHSAQVIAVKGNLQKVETFFNHIFDINTDVATPEAVNQDTLLYTTQHLRSLIAGILHMEPSAIDLETSFGEYGFTSLSLQALSDAIKQFFSLEIPPSAFFTFNTPQKIISYLLSKATIRNEFGKPEKYTQLNHTKHNENPLNLPNQACRILHDEKPTTWNPKAEQRQRLKNEAPHYSIIGINGIMPGAANMQQFWHNMQHHRHAIQPITRWNNNYLGGVIDKMEFFDSHFFGLSAREAMLMDPQHRLFLQVAYNTLLDAGYNPISLHRVGVFVGVQFNDYQFLLQQWQQSRHPYAATGNAHTMLANRISYLLNFTGPSQTIDTACSSAFIALRRAMLALEHQECDYALVGAVSLMIDPVVTAAAQSMGVLSPHSRCATFDASADGYVRGEGVGAVLLKRAEEAEKEGDHSYGTLVSCVENHGGRSHSLTAPNPEAQKNLLLAAYKEPGLAREISFIETHGTATPLGDPIEVDALKMAWHAMGCYDSRQKIALGAVKTHIGHLEPAAGIAALLKVLLCLKHKTLPANLHFHRLNPYIELKDSPFYIIRENQTWEGTKTAGISSFGFGGSNAHVVLRETEQRTLPTPPYKAAYLMLLSAKTEWSLVQYVQQLLAYLPTVLKDPRYHIAHIAYTLHKGRTHFSYRAAWIIQDVEDWIRKLQQFDLSAIREVTLKEKQQPFLKEKQQPFLKEKQHPFLVDGDTKPYLTQLQQCQEAYLQGYPIDGDLLYQKEHPALKVSLPGYVFQTKSYWFEEAADSAMLKTLYHAD